MHSRTSRTLRGVRWTATIAWSPNHGQHDAVNLPDGFDSRFAKPRDAGGDRDIDQAWILENSGGSVERDRPFAEIEGAHLRRDVSSRDAARLAIGALGMSEDVANQHDLRRDVADDTPSADP
jgi:hypothetical protein